MVGGIDVQPGHGAVHDLEDSRQQGLVVHIETTLPSRNHTSACSLYLIDNSLSKDYSFRYHIVCSCNEGRIQGVAYCNDCKIFVALETTLA